MAFGPSTTAEEVAAGHDLKGKNVIITGGYSGIGTETARVLAKIGANVIIAGRNMKLGNEAVQEIKKSTENQNISAMELDLSSFASVRKFVDDFNKLGRPLHLLINNAGVMNTPFTRTADGYEIQFATNFLGHFLLTNLLIPRLKEGAPSRVVNVSSAAHWASDINWDDVNTEHGWWYNDWVAYAQSKTANILFSVELNQRYKDQGITSTSLHPGLIMSSNLARHTAFRSIVGQMRTAWGNVLLAWNSTIKPKTIPQGASTTIYCALSEEAGGEGAGKYYDSCQVGTAAAYALDPQNARRLWEMADKMVSL